MAFLVIDSLSQYGGSNLIKLRFTTLNCCCAVDKKGVRLLVSVMLLLGTILRGFVVQLFVRCSWRCLSGLPIY